MHALILPHIDASAGHRVGVVIANRSASPVAAYIRTELAAAILDRQTPFIAPWGKHGFFVPHQSAGALTIAVPDRCHVVAYQYFPGGGQMPIYPVAATTIGESLGPADERTVKVQSLPALAFGGGCNMLEMRYYEALILASVDTFNAFPDRQDRRLSVGDACLMTGTGCPGHPANSHGPKAAAAVDLNYYTTGPTNHTQYVPTGEVKTDLYWPGGLNLRPGILDVERNVYLWQLLQRWMPDLKLRISSVIAAAMPEHREWLFQVASLSEGDTHKHHLHVHISFGDFIDAR